MSTARYKNEKVIEVHCPQKCGSTTLHAILRESVMLSHNLPTYNGNYWKKKAPSNLVITDKIRIIRDPVSRLKSVFSDRVLKKNRNNSRDAIKDWDDFVLNLETYRKQFPDIGQHTRPQIGPNTPEEFDSYYDQIFFMSEISTKLISYINNLAEIKMLPIHKKASGTENRNIVVTEKHLEIIQNYYKDDYRVIGKYLK